MSRRRVRKHDRASTSAISRPPRRTTWQALEPLRYSVFLERGEELGLNSPEGKRDFSAVEPFVFLRRLGGVTLLGAAALFVVQLGRTIGWDNLSANNIDAGPYLCGAGGLLALLAPSGLWPFTRGRQRRAPAEAAPPPPPADE
jgi:hypothetical protein